MDRRVDHAHAFDIDGEQYYCHMYGQTRVRGVLEDPERADSFPFTVKFVDYFEPGGRFQKVCFLSRYRRVSRREFCSSTESIVSNMLSDAPWPIPDVLLAPPEPWLRNCRVFNDTRYSVTIASAELEIQCNYRPGGNEVIEFDIPDHGGGEDDNDDDDDENEIDIEALLERVKLSDEDGTCSICLEDMTEKVVRMACSHRFHSYCVIPWLEIRKSCPYCRRALDNSD